MLKCVKLIQTQQDLLVTESRPIAYLPSAAYC